MVLDEALASSEEGGVSREGRLEAGCKAGEGDFANRLELPAVLKVQAWVAALAASGGCDLIDVGSLEDEDDLPSLPGRSVLSMRPFFSGDGVRDALGRAAPGVIKEEALVVCTSVRVDSSPELFLGASEGRLGRGGGLESWL